MRIERLAACLPIPILYESRRRHLQRFLVLRKLSVPLVWFPIIKCILSCQIPAGSRLVVPLDRTQWSANNLLMVSVIWKKRAFPLYWQFLEKAGSSNLNEQIAILRPVLKLLKDYEIVIIGDREFRSVELAYWLKKKKVYFALRLKQDAFVKKPGKRYQKLNDIGLVPGMKLFWSGIHYTKQTGFGKFAIAAYWKRKYRQKAPDEGWYILTNLSQIEEVIKVYQARFGIEAMFKDCKTGGYNLSGSKASIERLTRLVLLIAIAYICACLKGDKTQRSGQQKYVCRLKELKRTQRRHSQFWIGLYGQMWIIGWEFCQGWVEQLMQLSRNKLPYFQRGLRAMEEIQVVS